MANGSYSYVMDCFLRKIFEWNLSEIPGTLFCSWALSGHFYLKRYPFYDGCTFLPFYLWFLARKIFISSVNVLIRSIFIPLQYFCLDWKMDCTILLHCDLNFCTDVIWIKSANFAISKNPAVSIESDPSSSSPSPSVTSNVSTSSQLSRKNGGTTNVRFSFTDKIIDSRSPRSWPNHWARESDKQDYYNIQILISVT